MGELLTADELAARLRVRPTTILEWARKGKIESVHVSHKVVRFDSKAVERFMARCKAERVKRRGTTHGA